jgi:hypothetical protein
VIPIGSDDSFSTKTSSFPLILYLHFALFNSLQQKYLILK